MGEEPNSDRFTSSELFAEILHPTSHGWFVFRVDVGFENKGDGQLNRKHVGRFLFAVFQGGGTRCDLMMAQHPHECEVMMIEQMSIANESAIIFPDPIGDILGNDVRDGVFQLQCCCVGRRGCRERERILRSVDTFVE